MQLSFRFLWLIMFALWQGGFMFYGAVVVPVGTRVLGSESLQGFVTQSVTNYLNFFGVISLTVWLIEMLLYRDTSKFRHLTRWSLLTSMILLLGLLFWLHVELDSLLDAGSLVVLQQQQFNRMHSWYLIISSMQWALAVVFAVVTLAAWRGSRCHVLSRAD